jgi:hypothetical protein
VNLKPYMKFIVAAAGAAAYATQAAISDGTITGAEGVGVITSAVIAVLVFFVPNRPAT